MIFSLFLMVIIIREMKATKGYFCLFCYIVLIMYCGCVYLWVCLHIKVKWSIINLRMIRFIQRKHEGESEFRNLYKYNVDFYKCKNNFKNCSNFCPLMAIVIPHSYTFLSKISKPISEGKKFCNSHHYVYRKSDCHSNESLNDCNTG
jgi:NAD-dependent dihydropyrimidine dehydrogenase PreA subunit